MAAGYKDFVDGAVLSAADLEDYTQNQSVMRFASAATRDAALSAVKTEGMCAYLLDLNVLTVYSGSTWSTVGPVHGAPTNWTPTLTQLGSVTATVTAATYTRIGRLIVANFLLAVTGSGTGANDVVIGGLPATAAAGIEVVGGGGIIDTSATSQYEWLIHLATTTTAKIKSTNSLTSTYYGSNGFTAALASGDFVYGEMTYFAAADA